MNKARLGGVLGIAYCIAGFFLIFLGWNGAATYDEVAAQMPYIVSGGIGGLGLIVLGSAMLITQSLRADQAELRGTLEDLRAAVERGGVAGSSAACRRGCQWGDGDGRSDELPPGDVPSHRRADRRRGDLSVRRRRLRSHAVPRLHAGRPHTHGGLLRE